jgi:septum formation topological specificity factor MinE
VVKGMPAFMLNNGLLKVICQVISIATDHIRLSIEDKELILNDILQMCRLVIIFAIRCVFYAV